MNRTLTLLLALIPFSVLAKGSAELHFKLSADAGYPLGANAGLGVLLQERHYIGVGYYYFARGAQELPQEYLQPGGQRQPYERLGGLGVNYRYTIMRTGSRQQLALCMGGSAILARKTTPYNFRRDFSAAMPDIYYTWDLQRRAQPAFMLQPEAELRFNRWLSGAAGPYGIFSSGFSGAGVQMSLIF